MYKEQCDDALLSLQISKLAGEYEIVTGVEKSGIKDGKYVIDFV